MAEQVIVPTACTGTRSELACRLRKKTQGRAASSPMAGEVVLENTSGDVLEIPVQTSVLQYLNLVVTGPSGAVVSDGHYGDCFSALEQPYVFRLGPGETYVGPVSLLGNVPEHGLLPGRYEVQAVYEYKDLRVVSDPFVVELPAR